MTLYPQSCEQSPMTPNPVSNVPYPIQLVSRGLVFFCLLPEGDKHANLGKPSSNIKIKSMSLSPSITIILFKIQYRRISSIVIQHQIPPKINLYGSRTGMVCPMVALWRHGRAVGSGLTEVLCILVEFLRKHPEFQNLSSKVSVEFLNFWDNFETLVFVAFFKFFHSN